MLRTSGALGCGIVVALAFSACGSEEIPGGEVSGTGGAGGSSSSAGGSSGVSAARFGDRCSADRDCGLGQECLSAEDEVFGGGTIPGGLCSADCTEDPTLCSELDPGATCIVTEADTGKAHCFPGCTPEQSDDFSCGGRPEIACSPLLFGSSASCTVDTDCASGTCLSGSCVTFSCMPQCNSEIDCSGDAQCNLGSSILAASFGLCSAEVLPGLPTGADCDLAADTDPCRGLCIPFDSSSTAGMCADGCTLGAEPACGWDGPASGAADAACSPLLTNGLGDAGVCFPLCDCNADCSSTGALCLPLSPDSADYFGRAGVCDSPSYAPDGFENGLATCSSGGAGGAGGQGGGASSGGAGGTAGMGGAGGTG